TSAALPFNECIARCAVSVAGRLDSSAHDATSAASAAIRSSASERKMSYSGRLIVRSPTRTSATPAAGRSASAACVASAVAAISSTLPVTSDPVSIQGAEMVIDSSTTIGATTSGSATPGAATSGAATSGSATSTGSPATTASIAGPAAC